jgi:hypothetical protein
MGGKVDGWEEKGRENGEGGKQRRKDIRVERDIHSNWVEMGLRQTCPAGLE